MVTKAQRRRDELAKEKARNRRGLLFAVLSLSVGFGSWGYFMIAAAPNYYLGLVLLLLCPLLLIVALYEFNASKVVRVTGTTALIACSYGLFIWIHSQWISKAENEVLDHLKIQMILPPSGNVWKSLIRVQNDSAFSLGHRKVSCLIHQVNTAKSRFTNGDVYSTTDSILKSGGDAQTQGCSLLAGGGMAVTSIEPPTCADVTVTVEYEIRSNPSMRGEKDERFVYGYGGLPVWTQQPSSSSAQYCQP